jgi:hypothetical protein
MGAQEIDRGNFFNRDGLFYPRLSDGKGWNWRSPATGELHRCLALYDLDQTEIGQMYDITGSPPNRDLPVEQLARDVVSHYTTGKYEVIDYIFDKLGYEGGLAYVLGNEIKYASRAQHKGQRRADVVKIRNYATILLQKMDEEGETE